MFENEICFREFCQAEGKREGPDNRTRGRIETFLLSGQRLAEITVEEAVAPLSHCRTTHHFHSVRKFAASAYRNFWFMLAQAHTRRDRTLLRQDIP